MEPIHALFILPSLFLPPSAVSPAIPTGCYAQEKQNEFTDEQVLAAWEKLDDATREEVVEWFRSEVVWLKTFQNSLLRFVLESQTQDAGLCSVQEPPEPYDSLKHAPAQPIPRNRLGATSEQLNETRAAFNSRVPERKLDSAWIYDYGTREIKRTDRWDDFERIFRNALAGFPPDLDLAEAIVEQQLDDGSEQKTALAFNHSYTDRKGNVYGELTLYDAWASGAKMEMPDVDTLGILHDVEDDWKSFKAPVPGGKQKKLYARVAALFESYHHHRGLRNALARSFLSGYPALRDGYQPNLDRFHALWDQQKSTPKKVLAKLPTPKKWKSFLSKLVRKVDGTKKLRVAAERRRDTLHNDGRWVRQKLIDIMVQGGFLR